MSERRLVIFDCDGVLVDSEPVSVAVLIEVIREAGVEIDESVVYQRFLGRSMAAVVEFLQDEHGVRFDAARIAAMRERLYARFRAELKAVPGVAEMLGRLGHRVCVASSSQPERIRLSLEVTGLLAFFEPHIYSSSMVESGKPAPDLFLHAAQAMGEDPDDCVVIEDSPAGIEAATRAGMRVFAFVGGAHAGPAGLRQRVQALGPDLIFDDMRLLPGLVETSFAAGRAAD